ncbi:MAG: hypothetical protein P4L74_05720 [Candidatus Doudnabacteria bacterium]|nr:hypothetical protein [Candidatus Doudnabacteria bacterium]
MPSRFDDNGDLITTPETPHCVPDVIPDALPNVGETDSDRLTRPRGIPFCTPDEGENEISPAYELDYEAHDEETVDPWLEYHDGI